MPEKSISEIMALYQSRLTERSGYIKRGRDIRDIIAGRKELPLPELDKNEQPANPNLVKQGVDQTAMRVSSSLPDVFCPPVKSGVDKHEANARARRLAILGWWEMNRLPILWRQRARHLVTHVASPVVIRPDFERGIPLWEVRDPLESFPAPTGAGQLVPDDMIFAYEKTFGWLRRTHPEAAQMLRRKKGTTDDTKFLILEYISAEEYQLIAVGDRKGQRYSAFRKIPGREGLEPIVAAPTSTSLEGTVAGMRLEHEPNRIGHPTVVYPTLINLDEMVSQFDGMIGMYHMEAMLMAFAVIGAHRGVLPEVYAVSPNAENPPQVLQKADPVTGDVGVIVGGSLETIRTDPGFMTNPMLSLLERNQRVEGRILSEWGGEAPGNARTGRAGERVSSAAIDFSIEEAQSMLAASAEEESRIGIATMREYFGNARRSFWVSWSSTNQQVDYRPNDIFDSDRVIARLPFAGADINSLPIVAGQRIGLGTMSKEDFMEIDPMVKDVQLTKTRRESEALNEAFLASIQAQAQNPQGPFQPVDMARIVELREKDSDRSLAEIVAQVQREAQERQAQQVEVGAAEGQPGLSLPGQGVEAPAAIGEPEPSSENFAQILNALRQPTRQSRPERA